jgi:hypothetical protein
MRCLLRKLLVEGWLGAGTGGGPTVVVRMKESQFWVLLRVG